LSAAGLYHLCETGPWIDALAAAGELYRAAGLCRADLAERAGADAVTLAEAKGKQAQAEQDRDSAKAMRWVWGAVGLVLGAAITAGAALWR